MTADSRRPDKKCDLRILVGLLTGHCSLNNAIMRIQDDPLCPACEQEEETPFGEMLCHYADKASHARGLHTTARGAM